MVLPPFQVSLPVFRVPTLRPAESVPPALLVTRPKMVPVPPKMPLAFTVTALAAANDPGPFTSNVPPLTVVVPE